MTAPNFIHIRQAESDTVFNTAHIVSLKRLEISITDANRHFYKLLPADATVSYLIHVNTINTALYDEGTTYYIV